MSSINKTEEPKRRNSRNGNGITGKRRGRKRKRALDIVGSPINLVTDDDFDDAADCEQTSSNQLTNGGSSDVKKGHETGSSQTTRNISPPSQEDTSVRSNSVAATKPIVSGDDDEEEEGEDECSSDEDDDDAPLADGDYERHKGDALKQLVTLERLFNSLKDELYRERLEQVERRRMELQEGIAPDYLRRVQAIDDVYREQERVAGALRDHQVAEIKERHAAEVYGAEKDFENDQRNLVDELTDRLHNNIRQLRTDKRSADVNLALWVAKESQGKTPKGPQSATGKKRRLTTVTGPCVVYNLTEQQINDDLLAIKRAALEADIDASDSNN